MKKAQITLFLIMGVIFVVGAGILLYMTQEKEEISEAEVLSRDVPQELFPIKELVDGCIDDIARDAIVKYDSNHASQRQARRRNDGQDDHFRAAGVLDVLVGALNFCLRQINQLVRDRINAFSLQVKLPAYAFDIVVNQKYLVG